MEARYMNGHRKGSSFERKICVQLSEWWSKGLEGKARQDIYWRSSQSGGRATQRSKSGKKTYGSYGDIAAVDPVGVPLLEVFTLELKRGKSHGSLGDLVDIADDAKLRPFEETLQQVLRSADDAGSLSWLLVSQRDRRECMVYGSHRLWMLTEGLSRFRGSLSRPVGDVSTLCFLRFSEFLKVQPAEIIKMNKTKGYNK